MKKTFKKSLAVIMAVVIMLTVAPLSGFVGLDLPSLLDFKAEAFYQTGYYYYTVSEANGWVIIADCDTDISGDVTIPSTIAGYPVVGIADRAFYACQRLTSITIPSTVTSIGNEAFGACYRLASITIPDSVTSIGYQAFAKCIALTSITIPNKVTSIGNSTFYQCTNLTSVTIPDSVTSMGYSVFDSCSSLEYVHIPASVTEIGSNILYNTTAYICSDTKNCYAKTYANEYNYTFKMCGETDIPDEPYTPEGDAIASGDCGDNADWAFYEDGTLFITGTGAMTNYTSEYAMPWKDYRASITKIIVNDGITTVSDYAFYACNKVTSVYLSNNLTSIGLIAFGSCESLTDVDIPDGVTVIGRMAFQNCRSLTNVTLPEGLAIIKEFAFGQCISLTSVVIPDGVTTIGNHAFYYCSSLKTVTIPASVTSIGYEEYVSDDPYYAFYYCEALESITVDPANEYFLSDEYGVLYNKDKTELYVYPSCCKAKDYVIPEGVESFGLAFFNSENLTSVHIPSTVTSIDGGGGSMGAFAYCADLKKVTFAENSKVASIGQNAFAHTNISTINVPDNVTSIGDNALSYCTNLTSINIGKNSKLESIGANAFSYCHINTDAEIELYIPAGVTSIGERAFLQSGISNIVVDANNTSYSAENGMLFNKDKTKLVCYYASDSAVCLVPSTVTEIAKYAFYSNDDLLTVVLPDGIEKIGDYAFGNCLYLSNINLPKSLETIGNYAFHFCQSFKGEAGMLVLPDRVVSIGADAFNSTGTTQIHIPSSVLAIGRDLLASWNCSEYTICSDSNSSYAKTYAETNGYTFKLCGGNHTSHTCTYTSKVTKAATCTQTGVETFTCECGNSYTETIPETGHSYGKWIETVKPTATTSGKKVRTCSKCGDTEEQTIAPVPEEHVCSYTSKLTKAPTCTETGIRTYTCSCGNSYTEPVSAKGHSYGEWIVTVEPTINNSGEKTRYCTRCSKEHTQVINRLTNEDGIIIITPPSTTVIRYGDTLILYANINIYALPEGCTIVWNVIGSGVTIVPSEDGLTCSVTSIQSGDVTIVATVVDANGEVVTDANGSEIFFAQQLNSKAGFWQRLISFFKNLFGIARIIFQSV